MKDGSKEDAGQLLRQCEAARASGKDFPTIWKEIIQPHPLVVGIPTQIPGEKDTALEVPLLHRRKLIFGRSGFSLWPL